MCGIISYIGKSNCTNLLVSGIKKLEYRGYDSFGYAIKSSSAIIVFKSTDSLEKGLEKSNIYKISGNCGIFHTRWATNGKVSLENSHPQVDCKSKIAIVHNGIIENYSDIKDKLKNHFFTSETDTEVIPHLVEEYLNLGIPFYDAVMKVASEITGMSSFVAIHSDYEEMIAVKNGAPLILALDDMGFFISSDVPSVLDKTNRIIYLSDGDIVRLTKENYEITNLLGVHSSHDIKIVSNDNIIFENDNYSHLMIKEIYDQLSIWKKLPNNVVGRIKQATNLLRSAGRIYLIGSGSSYHVALWGAFEFRETGLDSLAIQPHELSNFRKIINNRDLLLIISQSGETADIIFNIKTINNVKKIGIINVENSYLSGEVDLVIPMSVGLERAVAATKSVSNSLIVLTYLSSLLVGSEKVANLDVNLLELNKFNLVVPSIVSKIEEIANLLVNESQLFICGSGSNYILSMEGALKIKEVTYIHAEALDLVSLKHGPLAMIEEGTKVIVLVDDKKQLRNLNELKARGAVIIGISKSNFEIFDYFVRSVEAGIFSFAPTLFILQYLSYSIAIKKGLDPDKPRNLAKSVTVR